MKKEFVCINCPMGCRLTAELQDGRVTVTGNSCPRGAKYAQDELTDPRRIVTALAKVKGRREPLPVKSAAAVPKDKLRECAAFLKKVEVTPPVRLGQVVCDDLCGTGIPAVATADANA